MSIAKSIAFSSMCARLCSMWAASGSGLSLGEGTSFGTTRRGRSGRAGRGGTGSGARWVEAVEVVEEDVPRGRVPEQ